MPRIVTALALVCLAWFIYELIALDQPTKAGYACLAAGNILALISSQARKKQKG